MEEGVLTPWTVKFGRVENLPMEHKWEGLGMMHSGMLEK